MSEAGKRRAAQAAAELITDGMLVGLGTGSTVAHLLEALSRRVAAGLSIRTVATSLATEARAGALGIPVEPFTPVARVDLVIDGIDEIDGQLRAIKGRGGALLREKIVAEAAGRMIAIADTSKRVEQLGRGPVPVEYLAFAQGFVAARIAALGGRAVLRGGAVTDQGNPLFDCHFGPIAELERLAHELQAIPGVLAHGLFLGQVDALCIGCDDEVQWFGRHQAGTQGRERGPA